MVDNVKTKKGTKLRGALYRKLHSKKTVINGTRAGQMLLCMRKTEEPKFRFEPMKSLITLPRPSDIKISGIVYPLIKPYSYANIHYDAKEGAVVYDIIEPKLNEKEIFILKKVYDGLVQIIDITLSDIKEKEKMIVFLEKSVTRLLDEYEIKVSEKEYVKIMYYIFRDLVGLNRIESLLNDPYIEDIGCDGTGIAIYVVHQKFGSVKTNIVYHEIKELREFVTKLAERCDRYISYADPLLDGSLPDGTRVQASLASDVTTRGPTFSIRKFREEPISPVDMIRLNTVSAEMLAYLWFLIENDINILIAGGVATGKTSLLNSISFFIPPEAKIVSIEDSVTGDAEMLIKRNGIAELVKIGDLVDEMINKYGRDKEHGENKEGIEVLTMDKNCKIEFQKPSAFIRHLVNKDIYEVTTATGKKVKVTKDHSLFGLDDYGNVIEAKPEDLEKIKFIATPRCIPYEGSEITEINLIEHLDKLSGEFLTGAPISRIFEIPYDEFKKIGVDKGKYAWWKRKSMVSTDVFAQLSNKTTFTRDEIEQIRIIGKRSCVSMPVIFPINDNFLNFLGLWVGDGCYDSRNKNRVIISNIDKECIEAVRRLAASLNINVSLMSDNVSMSLNSTLLYKVMKNVLGFDGHADTKRIPTFIQNTSNGQISEFLKGYFSADGTVKNYEASCSSQSLGLLNDIQTLLLRFGIISRISHYTRKDKCRDLSISSSENISKFRRIGFLQERKSSKIEILASRHSHHTKTDIIPLGGELAAEINQYQKLSFPYMNGMQNIGRQYLQTIVRDCESQMLHQLAESDIFWDKVRDVRIMPSEEIYVYDLSVPENESFVCSNIILHNTRELNLPHENWIPGVARTGFTGTGVGEVTMFELLRESFRQNPDYLIVGEIRGKEAYVMFQGMASGHPSISTIHAGGVEDLMKRLQTKPISLSVGLIESLDMVIVMIHAREKGKSARRVKEIVEIESIDINTGAPHSVKSFVWIPAEDIYEYRSNSWLLNKVSTEKGIPMSVIVSEIAKRKKVLIWMLENNITNMKDIAKYVSLCHQSPEKMARILAGEKMLGDE
ncbi:MAG: ATPase, T2SS/T4P/T4SS family [Candidatus Aenigmatarchaeota archaeon]